jgi:ribonuclease HII
MPLILAGIDEAGFGPMLGPLAVARAVFRIEHWQPGDPAPDLWKLLAPAVATKPSDPRRRIPIADSKKLKRPSDTPDPLEHLRRGVAAMLGSIASLSLAATNPDDALLDALGVPTLPQPWYAPLTTPDAAHHPAHAHPTSPASAIDANRLASAMTDAGVNLLELRVHVTDEAAFNHLIATHNNKSATTAAALAHHLQHLWLTYAHTHDGPRVVCDRQGGRQAYGRDLYAMLPDVRDAGLTSAGGVTMLEETPDRSRYLCEAPTPRGPAKLIATFQTKGETHHLPIALASMAAKLTRELLMNRFNAHWASLASVQGFALKPTAGYVQDARRWLADAKPLLTQALRAELVRKA